MKNRPGRHIINNCTKLEGKGGKAKRGAQRKTNARGQGERRVKELLKKKKQLPGVRPSMLVLKRMEGCEGRATRNRGGKNRIQKLFGR